MSQVSPKVENSTHLKLEKLVLTTSLSHLQFGISVQTKMSKVFECFYILQPLGVFLSQKVIGAIIKCQPLDITFFFFFAVISAMSKYSSIIVQAVIIKY